MVAVRHHNLRDCSVQGKKKRREENDTKKQQKKREEKKKEKLKLQVQVTQTVHHGPLFVDSGESVAKK